MRYSFLVTTFGQQAPTGFLLTQLGFYAASKFAERLTPLGISPPIAGLLRLVNTTPGRSQREIADTLGMQPSRLVALVDQLEQDGLLERRPQPTDRRQYALHLTDKGQELLGEIGKAARAHGEAMLKPLTPDERKQLSLALNKLANSHGLTPGVHPGYRTV